MGLTVSAKKIKGQIPYSLYVWVRRMAENRRMEIHEVIGMAVQEAARIRRVYSREVIEWARKSADCPNAVHFYAEGRLLERFEQLKQVNRINGDSGMIRAVLKGAFGDLKRTAGGDVQETLF